MDDLTKIRKHQLKLQLQYKQLIEQAYNLRQTDPALSDISEFKAMKLLEELNKLEYLNHDLVKPTF